MEKILATRIRRLVSNLNIPTGPAADLTMYDPVEAKMGREAAQKDLSEAGVTETDIEKVKEEQDSVLFNSFN